MKKITYFLVKLCIKIHHRLYKIISRLSTILNNGIHPKHRIMNYHKFFVDNINEDSIVLDVGCGIGYTTYDIAKKAKKVVAIDNKSEHIEFAKKKFYRNNITYIYGDATTYKFTENFDFIVLSNVLEHIKERRKFLNKLKSLTSNFLIRVPMNNWSWIPLYANELGLDYRSDDTHYIEYTFESFKQEMEASELNIISYSVQFGEIWAKVCPLT